MIITPPSPAASADRAQHELVFPVPPDLAATMDIQIPALAWQPARNRRWARGYYLNGAQVTVEVEQAGQALRFFYDTDALRPADTEHLNATLTAAFPRMIGDLRLDRHPTLAALRDRYAAVIMMTAPPFEALVLTILSQNRAGETVRAVYPRLAEATGGASAAALAATPLDTLTALIRPAGPYKARRLALTAKRLADLGDEAFTRLVQQPGPQALRYLEQLPGVAHKTAACVLVFAAGTTTTLPVDTHLFRVVDRLGLARHDGHNTKTNRDRLINALLGYGPELAPAHFAFLLVGRTTCTAGIPACGDCFLSAHCHHAATAHTKEGT